MRPHFSVLPAAHEIAVAQEGRRRLGPYLSGQPTTRRIQFFDDEGKGQLIEIPGAALQLLARILNEFANGNAVEVVPVHSDLTTQEAADLLQVSRPYLIKLLEAGTLPFHRVGQHRRIRFSDLMTFKAQSQREREEAFGEMVRLNQEMGLYDV